MGVITDLWMTSSGRDITSPLTNSHLAAKLAHYVLKQRKLTSLDGHPRMTTRRWPLVDNQRWPVLRTIDHGSSLLPCIELHWILMTSTDHISMFLPITWHSNTPPTHVTTTVVDLVRVRLTLTTDGHLNDRAIKILISYTLL